MVFKGLQSHFLVVLAGDGQQNATLPIRASSLLKIHQALADGAVAAQDQTLPAVFANRPAPQGIVQIQHNQLDGLVCPMEKVDFGRSCWAARNTSS